MSADPTFPSHEALLEHADFLRSLARALTRDEARADDVLQETWVVALAQPPSRISWARTSSARAYLATVVRHLASNLRRGELRREQRERDVARDEDLDATDVVAAQLEHQRAVLDAVLALAEPYKTTIYLRYYEGMAPAAIAQRQAVPVKTVKSRLSRALGQLRESLDRHSAGNRELWMGALLPLASKAEVGVASGRVAWTVGGVLLMKKWILAAAVLLLGLGAWSFLDDDGALEAEHGESQEVGELALPDSPSTTNDSTRLATTSASSEGREALHGSDDEVATTGDLVLTLLWDNDETPARDVWVDVRALNDGAPREQYKSACTDSAGRARFDALAAGTAQVFTDRGTYFEVEVKATEANEHSLELPVAASVVGVVRSQNGEPIAGAEIWFEGTRRSWPNARLFTTTQGDGSFQLRNVSLWGHVGARARDFLPSVCFRVADLVADPDGTRRVEFEMESGGGRVHGEVLDPDGLPVAGAQVLVGRRGGYQIQLPDRRRVRWPDPASLTADERGRFEVQSSLREGVVPAFAMAEGYPIWKGEVVIEPANSTRLVIQLERPATIIGRVFDADGKPYAGAYVQAMLAAEADGSYQSTPLPNATSAEDGSFELGWMPSGSQQVSAIDLDHPREGRAKVVVSCEANETTTHDLHLDLGATIRGRVLDAEGRALEGWRVSGKPLRDGRVRSRDDQTDATGGFLLTNLEEHEHQLDVRPPGKSEIHPRAQVQVSPGSDDIEIRVDDTLAPDAYVQGRVLNEAGLVAKDVKLGIRPVPGNAWYSIDFDPHTGQYVYGPVRAGRYVIHAVQGNITLLETNEFDLARGTRHDTGLLTLVMPGTVKLEIHGLDQASLQALSPRLDRPDQATHKFEWRDGEWNSPGLASGKWILRAGGSGMFLPDSEVEITPGKELVVVLHAGGPTFGVPVTCTLSDPNASWIDMNLVIHDEQGKLVRISHRILSGWLRAGEAPSFQDVFLPPGAYDLEATTDAGHVGKARLVIEESPQSDLQCEIVLH